MVACAVALPAVIGARNGGAQGQPFELLIRNGLVVDGTGAPARVDSVGIRNGRIAEVGALERATAAPAHGNAVRVLGKYVREQKIITLEEAVRKIDRRQAGRVLRHKNRLQAPGFRPGAENLVLCT